MDKGDVGLLHRYINTEVTKKGITGGCEEAREALGGRFASGFFCSRSDTEEKPAALDMPARMPVAARPRFCGIQNPTSYALPDR